MSVINTRIATDAWARAAAAGSAIRTSPQTGAAAAGQSTDQAGATTANAPTTAAPAAVSPAATARAALDAQADAAWDAGTRIVYDSSQSGRLPDMTKLSDRELAAVVNDKDHQFSKDESSWALGELGSRVAEALRPLESGSPSDLRAYQRGVKELYNRMDPDTRQALKWTPEMIQMSDKLIAFSEKHHGPLKDEDFWELFAQGQAKAHALRWEKIDIKM